MVFTSLILNTRPSTNARTLTGTGAVARCGGARLFRLPRGADQHPSSRGIPSRGSAGMAASAQASKPQTPTHLATIQRDRGLLASPTQDPASFSQPALRRHDPRQEPDAVVPHVRICAGGDPRGPSLPRLIRRVSRFALAAGERNPRDNIAENYGCLDKASFVYLCPTSDTGLRLLLPRIRAVRTRLTTDERADNVQTTDERAETIHAAESAKARPHPLPRGTDTQAVHVFLDEIEGDRCPRGGDPFDVA